MKKPKVVALLEKENQAIDYTKIFYIRTVRAIPSGSVLRWDRAEKQIYLDEEDYKSRDDIE